MELKHAETTPYFTMIYLCLKTYIKHVSFQCEEDNGVEIQKGGSK